MADSLARRQRKLARAVEGALVPGANATDRVAHLFGLVRLDGESDAELSDRCKLMWPHTGQYVR